MGVAYVRKAAVKPKDELHKKIASLLEEQKKKHRKKPTYDSVVVIGNGLDDEGNLDLITQSCIDRGITLLLGRVAKTITLCGGPLMKEDGTSIGNLASKMSHYVSSKMVNREFTNLEDTSLDLVGQLLFTKARYAEPEGWQNISIVTPQPLLARTEIICQHLYGAAEVTNAIAAYRENEVQAQERLSWNSKRYSAPIVFSGIGKDGDANAMRKENNLLRRFFSDFAMVGEGDPTVNQLHALFSRSRYYEGKDPEDFLK